MKDIFISEDSSNNTSEEHSKLPEILSVISKHNLSVDDLIKCGKEGLSATRDIKDRDGDIIDTVPDWNIRHKFFSSFMELLGYLDGPGTRVVVSSESKKEAEEAYKRWRQPSTSSTGHADN